MTTPAPVVTRSPTTATLTMNAPTTDILLTDTATHSPAATSRVWNLGGTPIAGAGANATQKVRAQAAGTHTVTETVTNADGTATSAGVTVVVTDNIASSASAAAVGGVIPMPQLPFVYQDPMVATPGLPTALDYFNARTYGTTGAGGAAPTGLAV